jgi:hypothetical protein
METSGFKVKETLSSQVIMVVKFKAKVSLQIGIL